MATEMNPIRTEADYEAALEEVAALWGAASGTPRGDRLGISAEVLIQPSRKMAA